MRLVRIACASIKTLPIGWDDNVVNLKEALSQAREQGADVCVTPELCLTGYNCDDYFYHTDVHERALDALFELLPHTKGMIVTLGLPMARRKALYNCTAVVADAQILGFIAKQHLAQDGLHFERRWFKEWKGGLKRQIKVRGKTYPFGDMYFDVGGVLFAIEPCEAAWVPNRSGIPAALAGCDVILNPSASHAGFGKYDIRDGIVRDGSGRLGVIYAYTNLIGLEAKSAIYDGGAMIASCGEIVARGRRCFFKDVDVVSAVVDIDQARTYQIRRASFKPSVNKQHLSVEVDFRFQEHLPARQTAMRESWETGAFVKENEFIRLVARGMYDFTRFTRTNGNVLSLSGGADSSLAAAICYLMVELGVKELGVDGFVAKFPHIKLPQGGVREIMKHMLFCAYQGREGNSSFATRAAAREVAEAIGCSFDDWTIDQAVNFYEGLVERAIGRRLTWEQDDITRQNMQARARVPAIWGVANVRNALLIATTNRSELVGFFTLDGDTIGIYAPLSGVDKEFELKCLRWLEKVGLEGIGPLPWLSCVNNLKPTPELRPLGMQQTTEDDLMPFAVMREIDRLFVRDSQCPEAIALKLSTLFPQFDLEQIADWVATWVRMFSRKQVGRERLAIGFHIDEWGMDARYWCRVPALSGGFRKEIAAMHERVKGMTVKRKRALLVVDVLKDFLPGGSLAVPDGEAIVPVINQLMAEPSYYDQVLACCDAHPEGHLSFTQWPAHCVVGTRGAEFADGLEVERIQRIFPKGTHVERDSYSGFGNPELLEHLKDNGVTHVDVVGLAEDFCVMETALDASRNGFHTRVILDACRGIGDLAEARQKMLDSGIALVNSTFILNPAYKRKKKVNAT